MLGLLAAHEQAAPAGAAVADHLVGGKLLAILFEMGGTFLGGNGLEHVGALLDVTLGGQLGVALHAGGGQLHAAVLGLIAVFRQLHHVDVHLFQQGADGIVDVVLAHRHPAVLNGHLLAVVVGEGEVRVVVDDLPDKVDVVGLAALGDDVGAVVAHHDGGVLFGELGVVNPAAADGVYPILAFNVLCQLLALFGMVRRGRTSAKKNGCHAIVLPVFSFFTAQSRRFFLWVLSLLCPLSLGLLGQGDAKGLGQLIGT